MPINIYRRDTTGKAIEKIAWLCDDVWLLLPQIEALSEWVNKNSECLPSSDYVADVGFQWRRNALTGGPVLDVPTMKKMVDIGMRLFLSEYPGFAGEDSQMASHMDYKEALNRLWNHSNLPCQFNSEDESLLFCLYKAERVNQPLSFDHLVEDVIHCLDVVNHELNGANPSGPVSVGRAFVLDRDVSFAISGIISGILLRYRKWQRRNLFSQSILDSLLNAVFKIAYAWDQVLAGDIDDLVEDLENLERSL